MDGSSLALQVPCLNYYEKSGCSTNPVGEKSPTGFFTCKKEKSEL